MLFPSDVVPILSLQHLDTAARIGNDVLNMKGKTGRIAGAMEKDR